MPRRGTRARSAGARAPNVASTSRSPVTRVAAPASPAITALLEHAVDYAGLFPPASLSMSEAVREYARQRSGPHAWALGRFVLTAAQGAAFVQARDAAAGEPWPLSVLIGDGRGVTLDALEARADVLRVESLEAKGDAPEAVAALQPFAAGRELYVEVPLDARLDAAVAAVKSLGARAKARTGGVTPDAIPSADAVARFLRACVDAGIAFKATAGLHHLVRGDYALTYEPNSPRATMFGFLNVFIASAWALHGAAHEFLRDILEERSPAAFATDASGALCWREHCLTADALRDARTRGISAFGSCSFSEPLGELAGAGLAAAA